MSAERWLSKRELAELMGVSTSTIERHVRPTYRVGGQNRYTLSDVEQQLGASDDGPPDNVTELRPGGPIAA